MKNANVRAILLNCTTKRYKVIVIRQEKKALNSACCSKFESVTANFNIDTLFTLGKSIVEFGRYGSLHKLIELR